MFVGGDFPAKGAGSGEETAVGCNDQPSSGTKGSPYSEILHYLVAVTEKASIPCGKRGEVGFERWILGRGVVGVFLGGYGSDLWLAPFVSVSKERGPNVPGPELCLCCGDGFLSRPCEYIDSLIWSAVAVEMICARVQSVWCSHIGEGGDLEV